MSEITKGGLYTKNDLMRARFGLVKFGLSQFLDLSLKRCTLGTSVDISADDFLHHPTFPREVTRGVFFDGQGVATFCKTVHTHFYGYAVTRPLTLRLGDAEKLTVA